MPQYMISVHHDGTEDFESMTEEEMQPIFDAVDAYNEEVRAAGKWVFGGGLEDITSATTVDNTKGERLVTDGPFSESKEYLGGFWVMEHADLDEALEWAQRASEACQGKVEVRPFQAEPA
ncbi:YciI family protein [Nocardioides speluncae]|uniref:YciI family protein n=1 Tax=Nocardioides speluncae TaxID=2670337 RepID=UPI000D687459|nr:YciI family protein [Nocardioides speluncae]